MIRLILLILVAGLVYLNYTNPTEQQHKQAILAELQQAYPIPEELQEQLWRQVDFSNFMVCSFMKTTLDSKMISTGYLEKVKVVNDQWLKETRQKLQARMQY